MRRRPRIALIAGGIAAAALAVLLGITVVAGADAPGPDYAGALQLTGPGERFGGFSAIEVWPDGSRFLAVSDTGAFVRGTIRRDDSGTLNGLETGPLTPLRGALSDALIPLRADSEGIALAADGALYVSFEGAARVLRYAVIGGQAENLPSAVAFSGMPRNTALEALAVDDVGTLYTLAEGLRRSARALPVYRFHDGVWDQPFTLPTDGRYLPVGADIGPDGRFYLLERRFGGLRGFASRVRRFDITEAGFFGGETLLDTPLGRHSNLEGLSVWRDGDGVLRVTMISDDNLNRFLRGEVVEYRVPG